MAVNLPWPYSTSCSGDKENNKRSCFVFCSEVSLIHCTLLSPTLNSKWNSKWSKRFPKAWTKPSHVRGSCSVEVLIGYFCSRNSLLGFALISCSILNMYWLFSWFEKKSKSFTNKTSVCNFLVDDRRLSSMEAKKMSCAPTLQLGPHLEKAESPSCSFLGKPYHCWCQNPTGWQMLLSPLSFINLITVICFICYLIWSEKDSISQGPQGKTWACWS